MNNQNTTGTGLKTIKHEWKAASLDPEQAAAWLRPAFGQWADALANHDKARVTPDMLRRLATAMDAWLSVRDSMLVAALDTSVGVEGMLRISAKPRDPAVRDLITKTLSETLEDPSAPRRHRTHRVRHPRGHRRTETRRRTRRTAGVNRLPPVGHRRPGGPAHGIHRARQRPGCNPRRHRRVGRRPGHQTRIDALSRRLEPAAPRHRADGAAGGGPGRLPRNPLHARNGKNRPCATTCSP